MLYDIIYFYKYKVSKEFVFIINVVNELVYDFNNCLKYILVIDCYQWDCNFLLKIYEKL